jgi:hypothetical protein
LRSRVNREHYLHIRLYDLKRIKDPQQDVCIVNVGRAMESQNGKTAAVEIEAIQDI